MHRFKRCAALATTLIFLATPCLAAENSYKSFLENVFYGTLTGGLVGAAVLAFTKKPTNHLDFVAYGAAGGMLVGAAYGAVATTRSLAEFNNGKVRFSLPTIIPELKEANSKGQTSVVATAELFRGKF